MAKMIKCPTCGTQIEVPPQAAGQIVKCPGCGKGLKLVAKHSKAAGAPQQSAGAGMSANPGGSVAGGSVSAVTFIGDPPPMDRPGPPLDDLPPLESNCAVCGTATDPNDLVEDNGRLVCMDCVKGARSGMSRPEGGAALIDFAPSHAPVRRGKLINFTPSFFVGTLAALVLLGTQVYLTLFEKPVGTLTAGRAAAGGRPVTPAPDAGSSAAPVVPENGSAAGAAPTGAAPGDTTEAAAAPGDTAGAVPGDATAATPAPDEATGAAPAAPPDDDTTSADGSAGTETSAGTTGPAVALGSSDSGDGESMFTNENIGTPGGTPAAGTGAPNGAGGAAAAPDAGGAAPPDAPAPAVLSSDPLVRGYQRLMARDFAKAVTDLDQARLRYVINKLGPPGRPLTPEQQMTLEGLAAAYIGQGRPELARGPLETAYSRNVRTRSLVLNTAIYMLSTQRPLNALLQAAEMVRNSMAGPANDEYAADIFGTLINRIDSIGKAPPEKVAALWAAHDNYIDQLAARGDIPETAGKLKWGVDWLPAEQVKVYRQVRGIENPDAVVGAAAKEFQLAAQRVRTAQAALDKANQARKNNQAADVQGAQNQLDAANAALDKAQKALADASAAVNMKKPRWLTKFEPVIPQRLEGP